MTHAIKAYLFLLLAMLTFSACSSGTGTPGNAKAGLKVVFASNGTRSVMPGDPGTVVVSTNMNTWTIASIGSTEQIIRVRYLNSTYFALGLNGGIYTSPDGLAWQLNHTLVSGGTAAPGIDPNQVTDITYNGSLYVAVGNFGAIVTSPDAKAWTKQNSGLSVSATSSLSSIAYGNGRFVAVGGQGGAPVLVTSTDAVTWVAQTTLPSESRNGIIFVNNQFVICCSSQWIYTSPDGLSWATQSLGLLNRTFQDISYGNGLYVITGKDISTGSTPIILTSPDAITWTQRTSAISGDLKRVSFDNNQFISIASTTGSGFVQTSPDGITWTQKTVSSGTTQQPTSTTVMQNLGIHRVSMTVTPQTLTSFTPNPIDLTSYINGGSSVTVPNLTDNESYTFRVDAYDATDKLIYQGSVTAVMQPAPATNPISIVCAPYSQTSSAKNSWSQLSPLVFGVAAWTNKAAMPTTRSRSASAVNAGIIYVFGGDDAAGTPLNTVEAYNPSTDSWSTLAPMPTPRRYAAAAAWGGTNKIYVLGGETAAGQINTVEVYDIATNSWSTLAPMPTSRGRLAAVAWTSGGGFVTIYAMGGTDAAFAPLATVEAYDVTNNVWSTSASMPLPRARFAAVFYNGNILAVGGDTTTGATTAIDTYVASSNLWNATSDNLTTPRSKHGVVLVGQSLYVIGGDVAGIPTTQVDIFNLSTKLTTAATLLSTACSYPVTGMVANKLYSIGGTAATGQPLNTVQELISFAGNDRVAAAAVWTGSEALIWGGGKTSTQTFDNRGVRYNPATGTSTAMSLVGAPGARTNTRAVWTGTEMLIWGGNAATTTPTYFNSGFRYNPTSDSWTSMSTVGAPTARTSYSYAWTGTELIVWGGTNGTGYFNNGARYNPATNSWTAMSATNAPTARASTTYTWTGTELIVWGGTNGTSSLGDGARYNPTTDSWTPMSLTGAPAARIPQAVWSGTEMLVWGGNSSSAGVTSYFNDGARYNPASDSWTAMATTGAPSARSGAAHKWSGSELIVWGGFSGTAGVSSYLNDGARYNPLTNSWVVLPASGAPAARSGATNLWTGTGLLVWGGLVSTAAGTSYYSDGALYLP